MYQWMNKVDHLNINSSLDMFDMSETRQHHKSSAPIINLLDHFGSQFFHHDQIGIQVN